MCVICSLATNTLISLWLSYQPTQADLNKILELNQRIEQIIQKEKKANMLDIAIQKAISSKVKRGEKATRMLFTMQELTEYNRQIYNSIP